MKILLLLLTTLTSVLVAANAQASSYTSQTIGNFTYYSGDINGYSTRIGNSTFYGGDISGYSTKIGNFTYFYFD